MARSASAKQAGSCLLHSKHGKFLPSPIHVSVEYGIESPRANDKIRVQPTQREYQRRWTVILERSGCAQVRANAIATLTPLRENGTRAAESEESESARGTISRTVLFSELDAIETHVLEYRLH